MNAVVSLVRQEEKAESLFDPALYAGVRRPLAHAESMPPWTYTSEAFLRREIETVFMKEWNFLGRADRIPDEEGREHEGEPAEDGGLPMICTPAAHPGREVV